MKLLKSNALWVAFGVALGAMAGDKLALMCSTSSLGIPGVF